MLCAGRIKAFVKRGGLQGERSVFGKGCPIHRLAAVAAQTFIGSLARVGEKIDEEVFLRGKMCFVLLM